MTSTAEIIRQGKELGLEGPSLQQFLKEEKEELKAKEDRERDERNKDRQSKKEELEMENKQKERQMEMEMQERDKERQLKLELAKITADTETARMKEDGKSQVKENSKLIKLPQFSETKNDDMAAYLHRFEMQAKMLHWSPEVKFINLSGLLSGASLEVLQNLTPDQQNFQDLKDALLRRYRITPEGLRTRFKSANILENEDADSFISRLEMNFDRWLELEKVTNGSYNELRDLMIRDQLYDAINEEAAVFIKERSPKNIKEVRENLEVYGKAHPTKSLSKTVVFANVAINNPKDQDRGRHRRPFSTPRERETYSPPNNTSRQMSPSREGRTYSPPNNTRRYNNPRYEDNYDTDYQYDRRWENNGRPNWRGRGRFHNDNWRGKKFSNFEATGQHKALLLFPGKVNGRSCNVVRDSGSSCFGVASRLCNPENYTGRKEKCQLFDGHSVWLDVVIVEIETPFVSGKVEAFALNNPVADLIVGNVTDIDDQPLIERLQKREPDDDQQPTRPKINYVNVVSRADIQQDNQASEAVCMETDNKIKDTRQNSDAIFDRADKEIFIQEQEKDESLDDIKIKARESKGYRYKDGLLYRHSKKTGSCDQLVVPTSIREKVLRRFHGANFADHLGISATKKRICERFSWPGIMSDIRNFVRSCETCKRITNKYTQREFDKGDKVLLLPQRDVNNLFTMCQGPHTIQSVLSNNSPNYMSKIGNACRPYHANPLKRYYYYATEETPYSNSTSSRMRYRYRTVY